MIKEEPFMSELSNNLICPICGKPTNVYMGNARKDKLCREHAKELKEGIIEKCADCGNWHKTNEICQCKLNKHNTNEVKKCSNTTTEHNNSEQETISNSKKIDELSCIICGKQSNGKHFCKDCWNKYKDKVLYIQVKQCKEFTKLEAEYEGDLICDDGHIVKSPYEKIIDNWLYGEGIKHAYEKKLDVSETQDITPDFYIPELNGIKNIYIEFWGYGEENVKYQKIKEYKERIYPELVKRDNITVVYLNKKEVDTDQYKKKIRYAKQGEIKES